MILDFLHSGASNALSARELAALIGVEPRNITREIEQLRKRGAPICASKNGYFLASDDFELTNYVRRLKRRVGAIQATLDGLTRDDTSGV